MVEQHMMNLMFTIVAWTMEWITLDWTDLTGDWSPDWERRFDNCAEVKSSETLIKNAFLSSVSTVFDSRIEGSAGDEPNEHWRREPVVVAGTCSPGKFWKLGCLTELRIFWSQYEKKVTQTVKLQNGLFWRRDYYFKTKIEIKLKIRIIHWVCCSKSWWSTLLKPPKPLVNKKVDLYSLWGEGAGAPVAPPPLPYGPDRAKSTREIFHMQGLTFLFLTSCWTGVWTLESECNLRA